MSSLLSLLARRVMGVTGKKKALTLCAYDTIRTHTWKNLQILRNSFKDRRKMELLTVQNVWKQAPTSARPLSAATVRFFHSTSRCDVNPVLLLLLRPVSKVIALLAGRGFRKWWQSLPPDKKTYFIGRLKQHRMKFIVGMGIFASGSAIYYASHIDEAPITRRRRFMAFTPQQFEAVSNNMFELHLEEYKDKILPTDHHTYKRVSDVANRLLKYNQKLPQIYQQAWSITIVNDSTQNAFVLSSGQIFVFSGMLELCSNDDQLGVVLGHEMAHAILGHNAESLSYSHLIDLCMVLVIAAIWAFLPSDLLSIVTHYLSGRLSDLLLQLPYSRMLENEADEVGLELAAKACFDVRESSAFWSRMNVLKTLNSEVEIEWLSTHPNHETRSALLDQLIPEAVQLRLECKCPPLPLKDPRDDIAKFHKDIEAEMIRKRSKRAVPLTLPLKQDAN